MISQKELSLLYQILSEDNQTFEKYLNHSKIIFLKKVIQKLEQLCQFY